MAINVTRSSMPDFEEYCAEIRELWDSRWLTNGGVKHRQLEAGLQDYLRVEHAVLFTNGHLALEHLLAAMDFPAGGEVITTPFTFVSTTHAIVSNGLVPVFCDVEDSFYTMDPQKIEALITDRTVAILPVHVYGNLCDTEAIAAIAKKHGLKVIYDAAHAFGVRRGDVSAAAMGDAAMFSFHATKVFNTVEGGAVCFSGERLKDRLNERKNFGLHGPEECLQIGGNAKMSEFHAAMGLCNLRCIDGEIARRGEIVAHYRRRLSGTEGIRLCPEQAGVTPNHAYFPVVFDGYRCTRDEVMDRLARHGIGARKYFYPLTNDFACYRSLPTGGGEKTPVARYLSARVLTLPLYADLSVREADMICDIILG